MKFILIPITWAIILYWLWDADITLDLTSAKKETYSTFLKSIRDTVKDPKLKYGGTDIPVIGKPTKTFMKINIKASTGSVSLGLKRDDLYVVAYMAKNHEQKNMVYYFKGEITSAQLDKLFPGAAGTKNQKTITEYTESYASIEGKAGVKRKEAGLGINKLATYMEGVNQKARSVQAEAKFLLVAIQMVSEAARFGYIENLVLKNYPNGFNPEDKVIILEANWGDVSEDIKASTNGVFKSPKTYKTQAVQTTWKVSNAKELNVGILKFVK